MLKYQDLYKSDIQKYSLTDFLLTSLLSQMLGHLQFSKEYISSDSDVAYYQTTLYML